MELSPEYVRNAEDVIARATRYAMSGADAYRYRMMAEFCRPFKKVLSVGSAGREPIIIKATHAMDVSPVAGELLKEAGWKGKYVVGSCTELPFKDKEFDCGICSEVIEHLPTIEDVEATLNELNRACKSWMVTTPAQPVPEPDHKHFFKPGQILNWCHELQKVSGNEDMVKVYTRGIWHFIVKRPVRMVWNCPFCPSKALVPGPKGAWRG